MYFTLWVKSNKEVLLVEYGRFMTGYKCGVRCSGRCIISISLRLALLLSLTLFLFLSLSLPPLFLSLLRAVCEVAGRAFRETKSEKDSWEELRKVISRRTMQPAALVLCFVYFNPWPSFLKLWCFNWFQLIRSLWLLGTWKLGYATR